MRVESLLTDPSLPHLEVALDPDSMLEVFKRYLRPVGKPAYEIKGCRLSRIRYRQNERCILQYALTLLQPETGDERSLRASGVMYAEEHRAEKRWHSLAAADPGIIPEPLLIFEPVSFIPELGMLVQIFPYDRRLPTLPLLAAGPPPELKPLLLTRFGPGDWYAEEWETEAVRYREQLGAVLRYTVRARNAATGEAAERRFYVKVRRDEPEEERSLRSLREMRSSSGGFAVLEPLAYLGDLGALVLEEAPGRSLEEILLHDHRTTDAMRQVARDLAAFNQLAVAPTRRHTLADQVAALERSGRLLGWACPHLSQDVHRIIAAIAANLEEVPPRPTHRDLKPDHIFLDGVHTVFIDLDSFAGADPVLDPALLLARLAAVPALLPVPEDRARAAAGTFAEEYFGRVPEDWRARLPLHYAGSLLEVAHGLFRRQEPDWPRKIAALVEEAEDSLAGKVWLERRLLGARRYRA